MRRVAMRPMLLVLLALAVSLPLPFGCSAPTGSSGPDHSGSGESGADPGRIAFEAIALPATGSVGADPQVMARDLYGTDESVEGDYTEEVIKLAASADDQVVLFTRMGLPDDSVRGMRYRLEFAPQGGEWVLIWAGRQRICWPGRGHGDWGTASCL
ncbi:MAG: hypothetical protein WAM94_07825 [Chromatiaceae bacterium]